LWSWAQPDMQGGFKDQDLKETPRTIGKKKGENDAQTTKINLKGNLGGSAPNLKSKTAAQRGRSAKKDLR